MNPAPRRRRGRLLALLGAGAAAILGWGYWHAASHGTVYVSLRDEALKDDKRTHGSVMSANLAFLDAAGGVLAQGQAVEPYGVVYMTHPQVGDCSRHERQAPYDDAARQAWQRCFETQSRWFIGWVKKVRSATVTLADCRMEAVPVAVREYGGEWWLWWIPLPHVGGAPYTHFDLALKIDTRRCPTAQARHGRFDDRRYTSSATTKMPIIMNTSASLTAVPTSSPIQVAMPTRAT